MTNRSIAATHDWTVAHVHALPDDGNLYEIIDGALYVTPLPRYVHQRALQMLYDLIVPYARAVGLDVMGSPADIQYSERTVVQPDLFGFVRVRGKPVRDWPDLQPLSLVVEVLSHSTRSRDRTVKRALYQAQGIPEYWIIDTDARVVERWRPELTAAERLAQSLSWQPVASHAPLEIDVVAYVTAVLDGWRPQVTASPRDTKSRPWFRTWNADTTAQTAGGARFTHCDLPSTQHVTTSARKR